MTCAATAGCLRTHAYGAVQGVGFRPSVYRLAREVDECVAGISDSSNRRFQCPFTNCTTQFAASLPWPVVGIQHHQAHVAARARLRVFTHQRIPPNHGDIALGQAVLSEVCLCV